MYIIYAFNVRIPERESLKAGTSARNPAAKPETKFYWRLIVFKMKIPTKKDWGLKSFFDSWKRSGETE